LLDSAGLGQLAVQGDVKLTKVDSGSLVYSATTAKNETVLYNLLTTPRSGTYHVILPDGTKVWLNNVSSLRYPTSFSGQSNRTVLLTGEAYFEIAKNSARPFIVDVNGEKVTVMGTTLNIKAYADEGSIQTTLVSGGVEVEAGDSKVQLHPDEQAQWKGNGTLTVVKGIDAAEVASWKDGFFFFGRKASFGEVMRQLARWYDVDVKYEGPVPEVEFGGKIDRSVPLEDLLKFLDKNEVHFRLEGRTLFVLPT
jgi:transmembrane sensor